LFTQMKKKVIITTTRKITLIKMNVNYNLVWSSLLKKQLLFDALHFCKAFCIWLIASKFALNNCLLLLLREHFITSFFLKLLIYEIIVNIPICSFFLLFLGGMSRIVIFINNKAWLLVFFTEGLNDKTKWNSAYSGEKRLKLISCIKMLYEK